MPRRRRQRLEPLRHSHLGARRDQQSIAPIPATSTVAARDLPRHLTCPTWRVVADASRRTIERGRAPHNLCEPAPKNRPKRRCRAVSAPPPAVSRFSRRRRLSDGCPSSPLRRAPRPELLHDVPSRRLRPSSPPQLELVFEASLSSARAASSSISRRRRPRARQLRLGRRRRRRGLAVARRPPLRASGHPLGARPPAWHRGRQGRLRSPGAALAGRRHRERRAALLRRGRRQRRLRRRALLRNPSAVQVASPPGPRALAGAYLAATSLDFAAARLSMPFAVPLLVATRD